MLHITGSGYKKDLFIYFCICLTRFRKPKRSILFKNSCVINATIIRSYLYEYLFGVNTFEFSKFSNILQN